MAPQPQPQPQPQEEEGKAKPQAAFRDAGSFDSSDTSATAAASDDGDGTGSRGWEAFDDGRASQPEEAPDGSGPGSGGGGAGCLLREVAANLFGMLMSWYFFVSLSFLTAVAAIVLVSIGQHGVAAIMLFVAVLIIFILICWLRLDVRTIDALDPDFRI